LGWFEVQVTFLPLESQQEPNLKHGIMEQWNDGILGPLVFHLVEKEFGSWDKPTMARKRVFNSIRISGLGSFGKL
jgi:hypothetical protein